VTAMPIIGTNVRWYGWWFAFRGSPSTAWFGPAAVNGFGGASGMTADGGGSETPKKKKTELSGWITEHRTRTTDEITSHDVRRFR